MKKSIFKFFIIFSLFTQNFLVSESRAAEKSIGEWIDSSYGVIVMGGIATIYSKILYDAAEKQEKESKANAAKVEKMIASFKDSYAGFCPKGREALSDPKCYCYTDDGKKNNNRSNSQTCIDLWNKNSYALDGSSTNYNSAVFNADVAGCVNVSGQFDENCKCKKLIDSKGGNACKKETSISMPNDAFSTALASGGGANDLLKFANNANNGNPGFNSINATTLGTKAIKSRQLTDALLSKLDKDIKLPNINAGNAAKYARAVMGEKAFNDKIGSSGSMAMNVSSARSDNPAIASALKQAEDKTGLALSGGAGLNAKKEKKKQGFDLNFGDSPSGSNGQVLSGFAEEKTYKYKNSDIVTDNSTSLFEIISNRYVQSGLKRLFDEEKTK